MNEMTPFANPLAKPETFDQIQETPAGIYCAEGQFTGEEILALGKN